MPDYIKVYEVGPRDGLQNEAALISTDQKKKLIKGLVNAGLRTVELTSFVNPKAVPQMADADEIMRDSLAQYPGQHANCCGATYRWLAEVIGVT
jgi:hydroxymethylglutaryl-CoA lyase